MQSYGTAREIMESKLLTLRPDAKVLASIHKLLDANITGAPVVSGDRHYLGIFSERCSINFLVNSACSPQFKKLAAELPRAGEIMSAPHPVLAPEGNAFDAISLLLAKGVSGAPVVDAYGRYLGMFSEKTSMSVLLGAAYEQLPVCRVDAFMDSNVQRAIAEDIGILEIMQIFLRTHYRRLPVLKNEVLIGQVTRQDALRGSMAYLDKMRQTPGTEMTATTELEAHACEVGTYMDTAAKTIGPLIDLLMIAEMFRITPYRRLPVVSDGELLGIVSREDLLRALNKMITPPPRKRPEPLYLSAFEGHPSLVD